MSPTSWLHSGNRYSESYHSSQIAYCSYSSQLTMAFGCYYIVQPLWGYWNTFHALLIVNWGIYVCMCYALNCVYCSMCTALYKYWYNKQLVFSPCRCHIWQESCWFVCSCPDHTDQVSSVLPQAWLWQLVERLSRVRVSWLSWVVLYCECEVWVFMHWHCYHVITI